MISKFQKLVLGSGNKRIPGAVHVDIRLNCNPDIVCDLNNYPWPFEDDCFKEIICEHIIEHLDDIPRTMREIYRIGQEGAPVSIVTPHFSSSQSWDDPTHKHHLSLKSFDYFNLSHHYNDGMTNFEITEKRIYFSKSISNLLGRIHYCFSPRRYESRYAFRYPARNIVVKLRVIKDNES